MVEQLYNIFLAYLNPYQKHPYFRDWNCKKKCHSKWIYLKRSKKETTIRIKQSVLTTTNYNIKWTKAKKSQTTKENEKLTKIICWWKATIYILIYFSTVGDVISVKSEQKKLKKTKNKKKATVTIEQNFTTTFWIYILNKRNQKKSSNVLDTVIQRVPFK